jgi:hypothetical protein
LYRVFNSTLCIYLTNIFHKTASYDFRVGDKEFTDGKVQFLTCEERKKMNNDGGIQAWYKAWGDRVTEIENNLQGLMVDLCDPILLTNRFEGVEESKYGKTLLEVMVRYITEQRNTYPEERRKPTGVLAFMVIKYGYKYPSPPIKADITAMKNDEGAACVHCSSTNALVVDHKNDLYNDARVWDTDSQKKEDFQLLCNHCNLLKRTLTRGFIAGIRGGERISRIEPPSCIVNPFKTKWITGDETILLDTENTTENTRSCRRLQGLPFKVEGIAKDALVGTYWYDIRAFKKHIADDCIKIKGFLEQAVSDCDTLGAALAPGDYDKYREGQTVIYNNERK